ncbi:LapA family protein [bacterium]|nr:LapA family protein [bacterium]
MKALKIIPFLIIVLLLVYFGLLFVENNQDPVSLHFGARTTPSARLGFVVMTSVLVGIILGISLAAAQVGLLLFQNRSLRKRLGGNTAVRHGSAPSPQDKPVA